ncbi:MAG: YtxH domain-containing protein [Parafilimonas sp.]
MNTAQKFLGGIMLGVAAGVAIALFINSDKGKEMISDVSDAASDATDNLKNKFSDFEKQAKDLLNKGKTFLDDIEGRVKDFTG